MCKSYFKFSKEICITKDELHHFKVQVNKKNMQIPIWKNFSVSVSNLAKKSSESGSRSTKMLD
jgi:hypothetical protein